MKTIQEIENKYTLKTEQPKKCGKVPILKKKNDIQNRKPKTSCES